jgi:ATP-dependent Lon protease
MTSSEGQVLDALDRKANDAFPGKVVRKDLVRRVKVGANVPVYVLEYLLGKYCASDDPEAVEVGLRVVNETLAEHFVRADEAQRAQAKLKRAGEHRFIDKVKVRFLESEGKFWAELAGLGSRYVHIPEDLVYRYGRLLEGGVWAQVDLRYDEGEEVGGLKRPFFITALKPIQVAALDFQEYTEARASFSTEEWIDLLVRSMGLEPAHFDRRVKLLFLIRLVPMVERNYNLIELGPRGTGKSFVYRELSPNTILISGGKTTIAQMFWNLSTNKVGLVGLWDVVAFDEVAGIHFTDPTGVQIMKDYMESGSFSRGREEITAEASIVFVGNLDQPVDVLTRTKHLFEPLPAQLQDMAFIDRLHFYLPGWETPKMETRFFTTHYGFVVDYAAEVFRGLRKRSYADLLDQHWELGDHLNARDVKAVRKTVSGLVKLLHPAGDASRDEVQEYLELALEGRRRVKEQLKKMGVFEYAKTSFSYIDRETREQHFVGVPEEGGRDLISPDPLPPGTVYTAALSDGDKVAIHRIEVSRFSGSGKLRITGSPGRAMRDSIQTAFDYVRARARELGIESDLRSYDFHVQVVDLTASKEGAEAGVAFFVALYSLLRNQPVQAGLVVLGQMTIHGNILPLPGVQEPLQAVMDNGAKKVVIPVENKRHLLDVPGDILDAVDPIFYADPLTAALKACGLH